MLSSPSSLRSAPDVVSRNNVARSTTSAPHALSDTLAALRPTAPPGNGPADSRTDASRNSRAVGRALLTLQRSDRLHCGALSVAP